MRATLLLASLLLLAAAAPAAAKPVGHDVPALFADVLPAVKAKTMLPVLLPDTMPYDDVELFADGSARKRAWFLNLGAIEDCGSATACFVASFRAERGKKPFGLTKVRLRGGRTGWFKPLTCGASCSPPSIAWRQHGAAYTFQAMVGGKKTERRILVRMANQAIRAGAR
jgi:hypothetical protein